MSSPPSPSWSVSSFASCPEAFQTTNLVNEARAQNGRPPARVQHHALPQGAGLVVTASRQAAHSRLTDDNWSTTWTKLGENVGYAWSLEQVQNAFMNSAPHRANILDWTYNKVGTGVTYGWDGRIWVVQSCTSTAADPHPLP